MGRFSDQDVARIKDALTSAAPAAPAGWLEQAERRKVTVHTVHDQSIEGILRLAAADGLLLWGARVLAKEPIQVEGEVFIPLGQVLFVETVRM